MKSRARAFVCNVAVGLAMAVFGTAPLTAHDIITTEITWNTDIARIVFTRCASCHRPDGTAFSLLTYKSSRPWAVAIKEEVLTRRMPPWGAAKGFGSFRNEMALSPEEIERIVSWVDGGVPEAPELEVSESAADTGEPVAVSTNGSSDAGAGPIDPGPPEPPVFTDPELYERGDGEIGVSGDLQLPGSLTLDGIWADHVPAGASLRILAQLPDGSIEPLLWLDGYREEFAHPFLLRRPIELPQGTFIYGVPKDTRISLLPLRAE